MLPAGLEPPIPERERPQADALDGAANEIGCFILCFIYFVAIAGKVTQNKAQLAAK
jgi:hypothetical protein